MTCVPVGTWPGSLAILLQARKLANNWRWLRRGGNGNYPGNVTFTAESVTRWTTGTTICLLPSTRTNGSLGPVNVTMATNNLPGGVGAANASNYGLFDDGTDHLCRRVFRRRTFTVGGAAMAFMGMSVMMKIRST